MIKLEEIKCPDLNDLLRQRESMPKHEYVDLQRVQTGLNEIINKIRLALADENHEEIQHDYSDMEYVAFGGYSEEEVFLIKSVLEIKCYEVSYRRGRGLVSRVEHELTVKIPRPASN